MESETIIDHGEPVRQFSVLLPNRAGALAAMVKLLRSSGVEVIGLSMQDSRDATVARLVVGLDTGFSHLAAALGVATVGIYCDHEPSEVGIVGDGYHASLGGVGQVPELQAVVDALAPVWPEPG